MRLLISVDIEGVAGVVARNQVMANDPEYHQARMWMIAEANAAIEGALDAGLSDIIVNDSHGGFRNLIASEIHPAAKLISGKPRKLSMMSGVEFDCNVVAMVGYHAKAKSNGVLAHTINGFAFSRVFINDIELGEAGIYGALAGEYQASVIFASGDDCFIQETRDLYPHAVWVETKKCINNQSALNLSPKASCLAIKEGMHQAVKQWRDVSIKPFHLSAPYRCRLQVQTPALADIFEVLPIVQRVSADELYFEGPTMEYIVRVLNTFSMMSTVMR